MKELKKKIQQEPGGVGSLGWSLVKANGLKLADILIVSHFLQNLDITNIDYLIKSWY